MTEPERPVVRATAEAVRRVLGREAALICSPGTYDQKHIDRIGHLRDCIAYGPGILDLAHQPDEYVEIADMVASAKVLALSAYAGRYRDPWYGDVVVEKAGDGLLLRFTHSPALTGRLEHWQQDTFVARWNDRSLLADAYITFSLNPDGSIDRAKMKAISPLTDFSFDFQDLSFSKTDR